MTNEQRGIALGELLQAYAPLWRSSPFHQRRPEWCERYPALTTELLSLNDEELTAIRSSSRMLVERLLPTFSGLRNLSPLLAIPVASASVSGRESRFDREVPGRKRAQIEAFSSAIGRPVAPIIEWCSGKGHLGRRLIREWRVDADAVERDAALCRAGETLSRKAGLSQRFVVADVMTGQAADWLRNRHAIALHACGDLHRRLIDSAIEARSHAIDVVPCCYQLTKHETYQPMVSKDAPVFDRADLKLAVTESVTASRRELQISDKGAAWKLAFLVWRERMGLASSSASFRPVPAAWLREGFFGFLSRLTAREGLPVPEPSRLPELEVAGWQRHREVRRLELVRLAFRRAIEVWLLCDLARGMERRGYLVQLREFCDRALTPRNLLLSARLI